MRAMERGNDVWNLPESHMIWWVAADFQQHWLEKSNRRGSHSDSSIYQVSVINEESLVTDSKFRQQTLYPHILEFSKFRYLLVKYGQNISNESWKVCVTWNSLSCSYLPMLYSDKCSLLAENITSSPTFRLKFYTYKWIPNTKSVLNDFQITRKISTSNDLHPSFWAVSLSSSIPKHPSRTRSSRCCNSNICDKHLLVICISENETSSTSYIIARCSHFHSRKKKGYAVCTCR